MAKEKSLVKNKLNILDKIKMKLTIRKLEQARLGQGYNIWNEIKNEKIKFNPEILELAWSKTEQANYKHFPKYFQETKSNECENSQIVFLSEEAQKGIIEKNVKMLDYVTESVRNDFFERNPFECAKYFSRGFGNYEKMEQILKINENPEILEILPKETQEHFVKKNPNYIYYCEKEVQKEILSGSKINDNIWKNVIKNDKNITLQKWIKYFKTSLSSEYCEQKCNTDTKNRKTIKSRKYYNKSDYNEQIEKRLSEGIEELLNSCDEELQKSIIKEIETIKEEENRELIIKSFNKLLKSKKLSINQQKEILPILFKNEEIARRDSFDKEYWDIQAINENFVQKYGIEKFKEYEDLINEINNGKVLDKNSNRILRLFFKEETIIKNVNPEKVIQYIKMYDEHYKNKENGKNTFRLMAEGREVKKCFQEIMKEAFGEKTLEIIEKRPGLSLFNISNTEVFNENITNNFSQDFIDDCLSYNFKNYDNWIEKMKNPEDVQAFKYYFDITSQKIGANAETMQNCMSKYNEFRELLIDASTKEDITAEQKESITKLCMWPLNICDVQKVEDLENINEKLQIRLKELNEDEKNQFNKRIKDCHEYERSDSDKILYNLESQEVMHEAELKQEEIDVLKYLNKEDFKTTTEKIIDSHELKDIIGLFLNTRSGIKKVKDHQMEELNNQFTNMEKIDEAIEKGEYGVKKTEIEGFTYIDLGQMPVSFAIHNPIGNNSEIKEMQMDRGNLSKEALESYLEYEEEDGISSISARPSNNDYKVTENVRTKYIYWNLEGNEVIHLSEVDGQVNHGKKLVRSSGRQGCIPIKSYKSISKIGSNDGEIAFYRRKREHTKDQNQKYGRKIIPDAAIGLSEYDVLKRFEKPIPIIVSRGCLDENNIEKFKQERQKYIQEAIRKIKEENSISIEDEFDR